MMHGFLSSAECLNCYIKVQSKFIHLYNLCESLDIQCTVNTCSRWK